MKLNLKHLKGVNEKCIFLFFHVVNRRLKNSLDFFILLKEALYDITNFYIVVFTQIEC